MYLVYTVISNTLFFPLLRFGSSLKIRFRSQIDENSNISLITKKVIWKMWLRFATTLNFVVLHSELGRFKLQVILFIRIEPVLLYLLCDREQTTTNGPLQ